MHYRSAQSLSHVQLFATPWTAACQASLSITISQSTCKFMSVESVMSTNHLMVVPFSSHLQYFLASGSSHQVAKVLEFSFSLSPSKEYSGLISFRMDWLDLLAVQETLKSLLQHHSSKASILWCSAFFILNSHIHT